MACRTEASLVVSNDYLELNLGYEINDVLGATIELSMSLLTAKAF